VSRDPSIAPRVVRILAIVIVVLILGAFAAVAVAATALPGCSDCHFKKPAFAKATEATAHSEVACTACHVSTNSVVGRTKFGLYEAFGMWVPVLNPGASDSTQAKDQLCLTCHAEGLDKTTESNGLRIKHATCAEGRRCVDCHSDVGHGKASKWARFPSMDDCVDCHRIENATLKCDSCHVGKVERERFSEAGFAVTHGPEWKSTHGMGDMGTCTVCHQEDSCVKCHGPGVPHDSDFIQKHGATSLSKGARCRMCHDATFCRDCHGMTMPHPKKFASQHSKIVKASGNDQCMRCHAASDCETCHEKHVHPGGAVGNIPSPGKAGAQ